MKVNIITDVSKINKDKWRRFVHGHPNGNIFQTPEMFDVYKLSKNYQPFVIFCLNDNGKLLGVLQSVIQKEQYLKKFTARSIIWGGPLVKNDNSEVLEKILASYNKEVKGEVIYTEVRNLMNVTNQIVFENLEFKYIEWLNFIIDLQIGKEKLFNKLHSSKRRQIRLSLKNGAKIIDAPNKNERYKFYDILSGFYKTEVKKPLPDFEFFELLYHKLGTKGLCKFFLIKYQEEIVGGIICPIFKKDSIYEFYIYGKRNIRKIYPSVLSTWAPIEWGAKMGYKFFNFMGAGNPHEKYGVREFKEKFGGHKLNSGRFLNVHKPILYHSGRFFLKLKRLYRF